MDKALDQARAAAARGEVPVGAVIVDPFGKVVAAAGNRTRELNDPTAHAEILAIRAACAAAGSERLSGHDLYVTLEPCAMCAAAIAASRIARVYYGASDPKSGGRGAWGAGVFPYPGASRAGGLRRHRRTRGRRAIEAVFFRRDGARAEQRGACLPPVTYLSPRA